MSVDVRNGKIDVMGAASFPPGVGLPWGGAGPLNRIGVRSSPLGTESGEDDTMESEYLFVVIPLVEKKNKKQVNKNQFEPYFNGVSVSTLFSLIEQNLCLSKSL